MLRADPKPHVLYGQGKSSTTILEHDGSIFPIISPQSHGDRRTQSGSYTYGRGVRPMHKTTLQICKPSYMANESYKSTSKQYFSGSKTLNPVRRPPLCPSMHRSQWDIGENNRMNCSTNYRDTYVPTEIIPANRLHLLSFQHKIEQSEGDDVKRSIQSEFEKPSYWTQYNRVQGKLGIMLGPGVPRERPVRQSYNVLTGEDLGPAWQPGNRRTSGNRILYSERSDDPYSIIG